MSIKRIDAIRNNNDRIETTQKCGINLFATLKFKLTSTCVHYSPVANDQTVLMPGRGQIEKRILDLHHGQQQVLLELFRCE